MEEKWQRWQKGSIKVVKKYQVYFRMVAGGGGRCREGAYGKQKVDKNVAEKWQKEEKKVEEI